jgi:putative transposase
MVWVLLMLLCWGFGCPRDGAALRLENLALRHQLAVLSRTRRPKIRGLDRLFWIALKATWAGWRQALVIVQPETVVGWHRRGFRMFWRWKSRRRIGRPAIDRTSCA